MSATVIGQCIEYRNESDVELSRFVMRLYLGSNLHAVETKYRCCLFFSFGLVRPVSKPAHVSRSSVSVEIRRALCWNLSMLEDV